MKFARQKYSVDGETLTPFRLTGSITLGAFALLASFGFLIFKTTPNADFLLNVVTIPASISAVLAALMAAAIFTSSDMKGRRRRSRSYPHLGIISAIEIRRASGGLTFTEKLLTQLKNPPSELFSALGRLCAWEGEIIRTAAQGRTMSEDAERTFVTELLKDYSKKVAASRGLVKSLIDEQSAEEASKARAHASNLVTSAAERLSGFGADVENSFDEVKLRVLSERTAKEEVSSIEQRARS